MGSGERDPNLGLRKLGGKKKDILWNQLCCVGPRYGENFVGSATRIQWALDTGWKTKKKYLVEVVVVYWWWDVIGSMWNQVSRGVSSGVLGGGGDRYLVELGISWNQLCCDDDGR